LSNSVARNLKGNVLALSRNEEEEHYVKLQSMELVFPFSS
jgi:hypothetical protein